VLGFGSIHGTPIIFMAAPLLIVEYTSLIVNLIYFVIFGVTPISYTASVFLRFEFDLEPSENNISITLFLYPAFILSLYLI